MDFSPATPELDAYPVHPNDQIAIVALEVGNLATGASTPRPPICAAFGTTDQAMFSGDEELQYKPVPNSNGSESNRK
jgi:hypothetical protein